MTRPELPGGVAAAPPTSRTIRREPTTRRTSGHVLRALFDASEAHCSNADESLFRGAAVAERLRPPPRSCKPDTVTHEQALAAIRATLDAAAGPVSIAAVDDHGEVVACLAMDGAARDTLENARRKAYTAARSDATSTRALAEKVHASPTELASFDPAFSFFHGGVAAFSADRRVGAVGVSGLPGAEDERLAVAAIAAAGLESSI